MEKCGDSSFRNWRYRSVIFSTWNCLPRGVVTPSPLNVGSGSRQEKKCFPATEWGATEDRRLDRRRTLLTNAFAFDPPVPNAVPLPTSRFWRIAKVWWFSRNQSGRHHCTGYYNMARTVEFCDFQGQRREKVSPLGGRIRVQQRGDADSVLPPSYLKNLSKNKLFRHRLPPLLLSK